MKMVFYSTVIALNAGVLAGQDVSLPFERLGEPFFAPTVEFRWAVTNRLPAIVRIYKVMEAPGRPNRETGEFNIYPSRLFEHQAGTEGPG